MKPPKRMPVWRLCYWTDGSVFQSCQAQRCFSSPKRPDRLWGPPSLLFNAYRDSFARIWRQGVMLTTHLHLPPRLRESGARPLHLLNVFTPWTALSLALIQKLYWFSCVRNKCVFVSFRSTCPLHSTRSAHRTKSQASTHIWVSSWFLDLQIPVKIAKPLAKA
jgi:hypothetical protein